MSLPKGPMISDWWWKVRSGLHPLGQYRVGQTVLEKRGRDWEGQQRSLLLSRWVRMRDELEVGRKSQMASPPFYLSYEQAKATRVEILLAIKTYTGKLNASGWTSHCKGKGKYLLYEIRNVIEWSFLTIMHKRPNWCCEMSCISLLSGTKTMKAHIGLKSLNLLISSGILRVFMFPLGSLCVPKDPRTSLRILIPP